MGTVKINPPNKLPGEGVTANIFNIWKAELENYLVKDNRLEVFMANGAYNTWEANALYPDRIKCPVEADNNVNLEARRIDLSMFLDTVARSCDNRHYSDIMQKSTSLQWIYSELSEYYNIHDKEHDVNIQEKEINFFDLFDLQYQPDISPVDFYNHYRNLVIANLKKKGDKILWQNNNILEADEQLSPTFEDMILANVLYLIDTRLPLSVKNNYHLLIGRKRSLMDYRTDILTQVPGFLIKTEDMLSVTLSSDEPHLERYGNLISSKVYMNFD